jgi:hypothetical protein
MRQIAIKRQEEAGRLQNRANVWRAYIEGLIARKLRTAAIGTGMDPADMVDAQHSLSPPETQPPYGLLPAVDLTTARGRVAAARPH